MRKALLTLFMVVAVAAPITEKTTVSVKWESEDVSYPIDLFESGVFLKRFGTNEIFVEGVTNGVSTRFVRITAPKGGQEKLYNAQFIDNNGITSELSNTYTQYFRLSGPKGFRLNEK